ncbi:MAG: DUF2628 domain-containing protein [Ruminococcaceae bacterium]|nr:DUF2628 domain-containing protein [Oscillospiraceae bacterium]
MSLYHNGESCVYCKAKLFSDDDVVYCPVCGAPHHRECYNTIGHCALESLHGTENEYSREREIENKQKAEEERLKLEAEQKASDSQNSENSETETTRCKMCGEEYDRQKSACPKCGAPNFFRINVSGFDFLGGVKADEKIDDEITAADAKKFVISNTHRYIPKFVKFKSGKKTSWNWIAFLFPSCWMFSRKMYKGGFLSGVLLLIASLISIPVQQTLINLGVFTNVTSYVDIFKNMYEVTPEISNTILLLSFISTTLILIVKIVCGIFGDYWYKNHTVASIKKIRNESHDAEVDYHKLGGVNIFLFLISYLVLENLPALLVSFIQPLF